MRGSDGRGVAGIGLVMLRGYAEILTLYRPPRARPNPGAIDKKPADGGFSAGPERLRPERRR